MELNNLQHRLIKTIKVGGAFVNQNEVYPTSNYQKSSSPTGLYVSTSIQNGVTRNVYVHFAKAGMKLVEELNNRYYLKYTSQKDGENYVGSAPGVFALISDSQTDIANSSYYMNENKKFEESHAVDINVQQGSSLGQLFWYDRSSVEYFALYNRNDITSYNHTIRSRGYYTDPIDILSDGYVDITLPNANMAVGRYLRTQLTEGDVEGISPRTEFTTSANQTVRVQVYAGNKIYIIAQDNAGLSGVAHATITSVRDYIQTDEPVGFDSIDIKIKRSDYHGLSAIYSEKTLGFTGDAADELELSSHEDIDAKIKYQVLSSSGTELFSAYVDMTTVSVKEADYRIVECKVAEIGDKTIFNNRVENNIDLNTDKTIDGFNISHPASGAWKNILIPQKHLIYTNRQKLDQDTEYSIYADVGRGQWGDRYYLSFPTGNASVNEFGSLASASFIAGGDPTTFTKQYTPAADHTTRFGSNTTANVSIHLHADLHVQANYIQDDSTLNYRIVVVDTAGGSFVSDWQGRTDAQINSTHLIPVDLTASGTLSAGSSIYCYLEFSFVLESPRTDVSVRIDTETVYKDSELWLQMADNLPVNDISADMILVHDALNVIAEAISENAIKVKSDFYAHKTSLVNPSADAPGYGALKAITNGYKIRGLFTDATTERNMPLSFKNAIKSLNALDCIGWGFSTESGTLYVRVEPWNWFYKNTVLLTITDANSVTVSSDPESVLTELNIGYKKYNTSEEYNSIDSVHSERSFGSKIKAVSNKEDHLCEFIADNYAIEETRRTKTQLDSSKEFKYDESIFVFELQDSRPNGATTESFSVAKSATNIEGLARPGEFINAKLSPRWCAERWKSYLFRAFSDSPMNFSTGTVNYKAKFGLISYSRSTGATSMAYQLRPSEVYNDGQAAPKTDENADIANTHCILDAETIGFEYPISLAQYQAIKANPYGMISVNGRSGWIKEFTYKLVTGMATFKLIAAHTFPSNS